MSRRERDKGKRGEREVDAIFRRHGFELRTLAYTGDRLAFGHGLMVHAESKRAERTRPAEWWKQARAEAPASTLPLVAMRTSFAPWLALCELELLLPNLWTPGVGLEHVAELVSS